MAKGNDGTGPQAGPATRRREYPLRLRLRLPSTKRGLRTGVSRAMRLLCASGLPPALKTDLEIVLHEALANAVEHGNHRRRGARVFLRCYAAPSSGSVILVRDEGEGFDPEKVPDPRAGDRLELHHGRGLLLMRALMDHVVYRRGGTEVLLFKAYPQPAR